MKKISLKVVLILIFIIIAIMFVSNKSLAIYETSNQNFTSGNYTYQKLLGYDNKESGNIVIIKYNGNEEIVNVPSTIDGLKVTETSSYLFNQNSTIKKVVLPNTLKKLYSYTFYDCQNLETITIPSTIEIISDFFISQCPKATNYTIPSHLEKLGKKLNIAYVDVDDVTIKGTYCYDLANKVIDLVNKERKNKGLTELKIDEEIMDFGKVRSSEISIYLGHERPNGLSTQSLVENQYIPCCEIIGGGQTTPESIVKQWLDSQSHRPTILSTDAKSCGAGCYLTDDGTYYWVFATSIKEPQTPNTIQTGKENNVETDIKISKYYNYANLDIQGLNNTMNLVIGQTIQPKKVGNINLGWKSFVTNIKLNDVEWKSSNTKVATVDENGKIKAVGIGTATVTAKLGNSIHTYKINVDQYKLGDINEDGRINTTDARQVLLHYIGKIELSTDEKLVADVNRDGIVNTADVRQILLQYIGKIDNF